MPPNAQVKLRAVQAHGRLLTPKPAGAPEVPGEPDSFNASLDVRGTGFRSGGPGEQPLVAGELPARVHPGAPDSVAGALVEGVDPTVVLPPATLPRDPNVGLAPQAGRARQRPAPLSGDWPAHTRSWRPGAASAASALLPALDEEELTGRVKETSYLLIVGYFVRVITHRVLPTTVPEPTVVRA